ncbi:MAG: hypothetical protein FJ224_11500 [Lentisphaerae bacterium]|nr:hypothetical protein [Planctomycetota bacterium]MBM4149646.1 hypothetical protein [Lentisphaerota bacterium]
MIANMDRVSLAIAFSLVLTGLADGAEQGAKAETLARHETVAEFQGTNYHRCMGLTSLCPDKCGESGPLAKFRIVHYVTYEKIGEYGDPKWDEFSFLVEDNMKHPKVPAEMHTAVNSLRKGDIVLLSWKHDYVTSDGGSAPERPLTRLEKIAPIGTQAWLNQIDRRAGVRDTAGHGPTIGSAEWIQAVSVKLGVYDKQGHGPTPDTDEWRNAIHWKAFGFKPGQLSTGEDKKEAEQDKSSVRGKPRR